MFRRLISAAALVVCAGIYVFAATERATFILTDGERKSGTVVFHGDQHENLINGYLNLGVDGGKDMTFPIDQVAVIDFVGVTPPSTELSQLGTRHMLVLRNAATQAGRFVNMTGGDTLLWDNEAGQRQQHAIRDVSRVYLNPQSARIAFNYTAPPAAAAVVAAGASIGAGHCLRVDAQNPWFDTGDRQSGRPRDVQRQRPHRSMARAGRNAGWQCGAASGQGSNQTVAEPGLPVPGSADRRAIRQDRRQCAVRNRHAVAAAADAGLGPPDARHQRQRLQRQQRRLQRDGIRLRTGCAHRSDRAKQTEQIARFQVGRMARRPAACCQREADVSDCGAAQSPAAIASVTWSMRMLPNRNARRRRPHRPPAGV